MAARFIRLLALGLLVGTVVSSPAAAAVVRPPSSQETAASSVPARGTDPAYARSYFGARYYRANLGRFTTVDPLMTIKENLVDPQRWNRYAYVRNSPLKFVDPDGRDALWVTSSDGSLKTLVIPIHFTGRGATPETNRAIEARAASLSTGDPRVSVQIIATDKPINGVLNTMSLSLGTDQGRCGAAGECINRIGGNRISIDASQPDAVGAAVHDSLHAGGIGEGYKSIYDGPARVGSEPLPGYSDSNIMTSRHGTQLTPQQMEQAKKNKTTKQCVSDASGGIKCGGQ